MTNGVIKIPIYFPGHDGIVPKYQTPAVIRFDIDTELDPVTTADHIIDWSSNFVEALENKMKTRPGFLNRHVLLNQQTEGSNTTKPETGHTHPGDVKPWHKPSNGSSEGYKLKDPDGPLTEKQLNLILAMMNPGSWKYKGVDGESLANARTMKVSEFQEKVGADRPSLLSKAQAGELIDILFKIG